MEFLGRLGIDVNLLIAQIINFGLLLWLLNRFVYNPVIKRIEKDEQQLQQAKTQAEELEREKNALELKKTKDLAAARKQTKEIVQEAKLVAAATEEQARREAEEVKDKYLAQAKDQIEAGRGALEKEIFSKLSDGLSKEFQFSLKKTMDASMRRNMQKIFFTILLRQIGALSLDSAGLAATAGAISELKKEMTGRSGGAKEYERNVQKIFRENLGPVVFEYAFPPGPEAVDEIEKKVAEKTGLTPAVVKKQNESLLSGFRFEIAGNLLDCNLHYFLSSSLNNAISAKK